MAYFNIFYFYIFSFYYKDGKYKNDIPWLTASCIVATSLYLLFLALLQMIFLFILDQDYIVMVENRILAIFGGLSFNFLSYLWFTNEKKYLIIYKRYKNSSKDKNVFKFLGWFFVFLCIMANPILSLFIHNVLIFK